MESVGLAVTVTYIFGPLALIFGHKFAKILILFALTVPSKRMAFICRIVFYPLPK